MIYQNPCIKSFKLRKTSNNMSQVIKYYEQTQKKGNKKVFDINLNTKRQKKPTILEVIKM
jgi:hypothetical protein